MRRSTSQCSKQDPTRDSRELRQSSRHSDQAEADTSVPPQGPGGSSRHQAPSWMLHAESAVTLLRSSARGTDCNHGPSSGWGLIGGNSIYGGTPATASPKRVPRRASQPPRSLPAACPEALLTVTAGKPGSRPHRAIVSSLPGPLEPAQLSPTPYLPPLSSSLEPPSLFPIPADPCSWG